MPKPANYRERINLEMSTTDMIMSMSEGNPGAVSVCVNLLNSQHDPDAFAGGFSNILDLDTHGIFGPNIWILFNDCCNQSVLGVVTVLRACQLSIISEAILWDHIDGSKRFDLADLCQKVKKMLPNFNPNNETL